MEQRSIEKHKQIENMMVPSFFCPFPFLHLPFFSSLFLALQLFKGRATEPAIDLIAAMLTYEPQKRITAAGALTHPFFDELRSPTARLPDGEPLPPLFNFTDEELALFKDSPDVLEVLIPPHARTPANWKRGPLSSSSSSSSSGSASAGASKPADGAVRTGSGSGAARDSSSRASDLTLSSPTAAAVGSSAAAAAAGKGGAAPVPGKTHNTLATASESVASPRQSAASGAATGR